MPGVHRPDTVPVEVEGGGVRHVPLAEWRSRVLPAGLRRAWTEPDELARLVECALDVNLDADVLPAAEHLTRIDPDRDRRYGLPAIVLARNGHFRRAEDLLDHYASLYGETWWGFYAAAEVCLSGNRRVRGQLLLREALRLDPDASRPLKLLTIDAARDGSDKVVAAVRDVARASGGWRAKLLLAASFAEDTGEVLKLVREAVEHSRDERDVLAYASSVLAHRGQIAALVDFVAPRYLLDRDRLECGVNLLYAFLMSGRKVQGEALLQRLERRLEKAGLHEHVEFYRTGFRNLREGVTRGETDIDLLKAMSEASRRGTTKAWRRCWEMLTRVQLLVPVRRAWIEIPLFDNPWPDDTCLLELVTGIDSEGREVVVAFTDDRTLRAWGPLRSPCVAMSTPALLEVVADARECALLVNPAGPSATELQLPDIEAWLAGSEPLGLESTIRFLAAPLRRKIPDGFFDRAAEVLRESGIVNEAWLFEMVDDRKGVNPATAVTFQSDAGPSARRELLIDATDEVRWDTHRSRRVRFIPLEEGPFADYVRKIGVRLV